MEIEIDIDIEKRLGRQIDYSPTFSGSFGRCLGGIFEGHSGLFCGHFGGLAGPLLRVKPTISGPLNSLFI